MHPQLFFLLLLFERIRSLFEKNCLFWKRWFNREIHFISDLLNSDGKFLTLEEFQSKLDFNVNYLNYFQLISAIPPDLKRKAFVSPTPDPYIGQPKTINLNSFLFKFSIGLF